MTIVYLYTALTTMGGADRIVTQKANYLADKLGYRVYIITDSQNGKPPIFRLSDKVRHIDLNIDFDQQYKYTFFKRGYVYLKLMRIYRQRLLEQFKRIKPDIVISTLGRDMDFLTDLKDGSLKIGESHIAKQYMRNLHLMEKAGKIHQLIAQKWRKKQEKAIKKLDAFVVLTRNDQHHWSNIRPSTIITNPLTISPDKTSKCQGDTVISVGRFTEQKGYDLLIKAWVNVAKQYPNWKLKIYGEGELKNELEQQIGSTSMNDYIHMFPPTKQIVEKYLESAFYVMSSRFEGFGLVLTEAMACGLPCISFNCPSGPAEIIKEGEDGLLIENGNIEKLSEAILYLIKNEEERKRMGVFACKNSLRFSEENIMQQWDNLFKSLTKQS